MGTPFRAEVEEPIECPRCRTVLPPRDVAPCVKGCGIWVTAFAATEVLTPTDRTEDSITRWWKVRAPCPHCREKMTLRGTEPGFLQGCDVHGFWVDADAVRFTGLAAGVDETALDAKRADTDRVDAERAARYAMERERAQRKAELERLEAELDQKLDPGANPYALELGGRAPAPVHLTGEAARQAREEARRREEQELAREVLSAPRHGGHARTDAERQQLRRRLKQLVVTGLETGDHDAIAELVVELFDRIERLEARSSG